MNQQQTTVSRDVRRMQEADLIARLQEEIAAMDVGQMFFARYVWQLDNALRVHRTLWLKSAEGAMSGWTSHAASIADARFKDPRPSFPAGTSINLSMRFELLFGDLPAQIDMLLRHDAQASLKALLMREHLARG